MPEVQVLRSIGAVSRQAWDACFPGALEGHDYLAAVEAARLPGFEPRYVIASDGERLLAAAPAFFTDYDLDASLPPLGRRLARTVRQVVPRAMVLRLAAIGSACTETAGLGFHPDVAAGQQAGMAAQMLAAFEAAAGEEGCWLMAIKDAPEDGLGLWSEVAKRCGYKPVPGMPSAELAIDFETLDGYFARLSGATRKDLRRKLRAAGRIRVERRQDLGGLETRVLELYHQTRDRSELKFETLTFEYFSEVLKRLGDRAFCQLYWLDDDLVGINLLLQDSHTLLDKYFCADDVRGREHNLYFLSWIRNIEICLVSGLSRYQSGQAGYETKLRLGSRLTPTHMYFRHRRPLVDLALRWAAPMLAHDPVPRRAA
jgi:hypothetical protein